MSLSKEIISITECCICTEPFKDPRVLPCVHTFCLRCLQSYGRSKECEENALLSCPICRAKFELPSKKFEDLPVNFFIQKLLDVNKIVGQPNENVSCDACNCEGEEGSQEEDDDDAKISAFDRTATVYCFDCRQSLCRKCSKVHNKLRYNRRHLTVEYGKKEFNEILKSSPTYCELHQDDVIKFFCSDCQMAICMSCYVEGHSLHKCCNIVTFAEEFIRHLQEDVSKVSEQMVKCQSAEEKIQKKKQVFLQSIEKKESLLRETETGLHEIVDDYVKLTLADLESAKEVKLKEFEVVLNENQDRMVMMESFTRYSQELMSKATPADVARLATMMKKRAGELQEFSCECVGLHLFDVKILSPNFTEFLTRDGEKLLASNIVVFNSRDGSAESYLSPPKEVSKNIEPAKTPYGITMLGQELYLLCKMTQAVTAPVTNGIIGTGITKAGFSSTLYSTPAGQYNLASYTQCNSVICHLQLSYVKTNSGSTMELVISNLCFVESEGGTLNNNVVFDLRPYQLGQPSAVTQNIMLKAPGRLAGYYIYGVNFQIQISSGTDSSLTVQVLSATINPASAAYASESKINIPMTNVVSVLASISTDPDSFYLDVYGAHEDSFAASSEYMKPVRRIYLPTTLNPADLVSCSRYKCVYVSDKQNPNSILRVGMKGKLRSWPLNDCPCGLSVTSSHTLIVTFSQTSRIREFTTFGNQLREISLIGITNSLQFSELTSGQFVVVTGEMPMHRVTFVEAINDSCGKKEGTTETEDVNENKVCSSENVSTSTDDSKVDDIDVLPRATDLSVEATSEQPATEERLIGLSETKDESSRPVETALESSKETDKVTAISEDISNMTAVTGTPVQTIVDRFGFVFLLTSSDSKVHLISPQLTYERELLSLDAYGMQQPSKMHFDEESGQLYVSSTQGTKRFLVFQVTEGKVDPSGWKKVVG